MLAFHLRYMIPPRSMSYLGLCIGRMSANGEGPEDRGAWLFTNSIEEHQRGNSVWWNMCFGRTFDIGGAIMMMGGPCTGKTTRAKQLRTYFRGIGLRVVIVGEDWLGWTDKNELYRGPCRMKR